MKDVSCFLSGLIRLCGPLILMVLWHKKTGARYIPALAALAVCFPVFITAGAIRSGFDHSSASFYLKQALLYGVFEEGSKYLVLRYLLTSFQSRRDAVSYGIGHSAFEEIGAGMACFGLIGTGNAAPDILLFSLLSAFNLFCIAVTVIIMYGIKKEKSVITLPAAILLHFTGNLANAVLIEPIAITVNVILTAGCCYAAYRCYKSMWDPFEDEP